MKKYAFPLFFLVLLFTVGSSRAADGDTTFIETFTFGSSQNDWFEFPPPGKKYEKILMYYTLKCVPGGAGGAPYPCGEWDYLTYNYLYDHTGMLDSNLLTHHNFEVDGQSMDTFQYMSTPAWRYWLDWDYFIVYTDTQSLDTAKLGAAQQTSAQPFNTANPRARSQYLWLSGELKAAGLVQDSISGLRFDIQAPGNALKNLTIRLKNTAAADLDHGVFDNDGLTTVYEQTTDFLQTGWQSLSFIQPFVWDSTQNLLVDISFDNPAGGSDNMVHASTAVANLGIYANTTDYALDFEGKDLVDVPVSAVADLDSLVTISFWQYGDPNIQPQNDYAFEAYDADGNRVLNSHLPWSNGRVYWDAGNDGGNYDRIDKQANADDYMGRWNHWAFTKDVASGQMKIYLNGSLWHSGSGKMYDFSGITTFHIGARGNSGSNYDGLINEFALWDVVLDEATIADWMYRDITSGHPAYNNLKFYYPLNEGSGSVAGDAGSLGFDGSLFGLPAWEPVNGPDMYHNTQVTNLRPDIVFEQGKFTSYIDSIYSMDSAQVAPLSVVLFEDTDAPNVPTDTITVWPQYYHQYVYDAQGNAIDSTLVPYDEVLYRVDTEYYGEPYEVVDRYELGRFITPYGINLTLGDDGFTWVYDVTDYAPLLQDSVHLSAGNWQELMEMTFVMIEGTPERDVLKIENIWNGSFGLSSFDQTVAPKTIPLESNAEMWRLKTRTTGHGFGHDQVNCAEFCNKDHSVMINGVTRYVWELWNECSNNPLYPQGGTWVYDRAGWCPGDKVLTYDHELTSYIPDEATDVELDYNYETWDNWGNYVLETQLISYSAPNFELDAALEDVLAPNDWEYYGRFNPICDNPIVRIKNRGSSPITSLIIKYGVQGGDDWYYEWNGVLDFLETEDIVLPPFNWQSADSSQKFIASIHCVNGYEDEYSLNDIFRTDFILPPVYDSIIVCEIATNARGVDNSYYLTNENGDTLYSRDILGNNVTYRDTFILDPGCYVFKLNDLGNNGMSWWAAQNEGNGYVTFRKFGSGFYNFFYSDWHEVPSQSGGDFGEGIIHHFTISHPLGEGAIKTPPEAPEPCEKFYAAVKPATPLQRDKLQVDVYPNPTDRTAYFTTNINGEYELHLYDLIGQEVRRVSRITSRSFALDKGELPNGIYIYEIRQAGQPVASGKLAIQ